MKLTPTLKPYKDKSLPEYKWTVYFTKNAKRKSRVFKTKKAASEFLEEQQIEVENLGHRRASVLTSDVRLEAADCQERLNEYGKTLTEATDHFISFLKATAHGKRIADLRDKFIQTKKQEEVSLVHLRALERHLDEFIKIHGDKSLQQIVRNDIYDYLTQIPHSAHTRNQHRTVLQSFFSWCVRSEYLERNPVNLVKPFKTENKPPVIYKPSELRIILDLAVKLKEKDILACIVLGAFAGLRTAEIERLKWSAVKADHIDVGVDISKTSTRRFVDIRPALQAWLKKYFKNASGSIQKTNYPNRLQDFRNDLKKGDKEAGRKPLKWKPNALRHSFASYFLAETEDGPKTSFQLGHRDPNLLYTNYKNVATKKAASEFWQLLPASK